MLEAQIQALKNASSTSTSTFDQKFPLNKQFYLSQFLKYLLFHLINISS